EVLPTSNLIRGPGQHHSLAGAFPANRIWQRPGTRARYVGSRGEKGILAASQIHAVLPFLLFTFTSSTGRGQNIMTTRNRIPGKRGFTLIELLVVIAIIGILAA